MGSLPLTTSSVSQSATYARLVAAIIIGAGIVAASILSSSYLYQISTETTTTTVTYTSTIVVSSTTTIITETSSATGISTSSNTSSVSTNTGSSVTSSSSFPVRILWVREVTSSSDQNGTLKVVFLVNFENNGTSSIYYVSGCGSSLSTSILSGHSSVLRQIPTYVKCLCAEFATELKQGQNATVSDPGCWSEYSFELVGHGSVTVNMTLGWSDTPNSFPGSNSTTFQAQFTL